MNISQLAQRIARHLDVPDPFNLPSAAALDVVNAINSGLQLFFTEAPSVLKRTTFSTTFRAPVSLSLTFTAQYSNIVVGNPFDQSWYGCGVNIEGCSQRNEIIAPNALLDEWIKPTLQANAQVFFDCQTIPVTIERITSDVRAYSNDFPEWKLLHRDQAMTHTWNRFKEPHGIHGRDSRYYRIEPTAIVSGGNTVALLRIYPAPSVDTIIRFEAEISAASVTAADLITGRALPIADAWAPLLIPLCEDALSYSPLWGDTKARADVRNNAAYVIANRIKKLPQDIAVTGGRVGTPWGF
jgi:hypothetical protein